MNETLHNLIESLREELKQYGEMLALLDQQQQMVLLRNGPELLQCVSAVDAQAETLRIIREEREQCRRRMAHLLELDESTSFKELTARVPADYRPLIGALVDENNQLLTRVQQRSRQNHLLLNRAVELMQRFINTLIPAAHPVTYTDSGVSAAGAPSPFGLYEAVG